MPYLIWKPIHTIMVFAALTYCAIRAPHAYNQSLPESLAEGGQLLNEEDQRYLSSVSHASRLAVLGVYLVLGLVFIYVVVR